MVGFVAFLQHQLLFGRRRRCAIYLRTAEPCAGSLLAKRRFCWLVATVTGAPSHPPHRDENTARSEHSDSRGCNPVMLDTMLFLSSPCMGGLWRESMVRCADNTGVIKACIIGIRNKHGNGKIGARIRVSVRDKTPECTEPKLPKGIIVRRKADSGRKDGSHIRFDDNAFIIIQKNKAQGTKIKGPVPMEIRHSLKTLARWIF